MAEPDSFRVNPSNTLLSGLSAPAPENAGPNQLAKLGGALQQAGGAAAGIYTDILREQNTSRTLEALTELNDEATRLRVGEDGQGGYITQLGRNALERENGLSLEDEYGTEIDKRIEGIEAKLGNSAQRRAFRERAMGIRGQFVEGVRGHTAKQAQAYEIDTRAGAVGSFARQMATSAGDPELLESARAGITAQIMGGDGFRGIKDLLGMDAETAKIKLQESLTFGHLAVAKGLEEAGDWEGLEAHFKKYGDDLTAEGYAQISGAINTGVVKQQGNLYGAKVFDELSAGGGTATAPSEVLMPVSGNWTPSSRWGAARDGGRRSHKGLDMAVPEGTAVRAGHAGTVKFKDQGAKGYGKYAVLQLDDGKTEIRLAHLSRFANLEDGARVNKGDIVAYSGNTGSSSGPHIHYEVRVNGAPVDPEKWHAGRPQAPERGGVGGAVSREEGLRRILESDLHPKAKDYAVDQFNRMHSAREADKRDRDQANEDAAYRAVAEGRPVPASIEAALPGTTFARLKEFQRAREKQAAGERMDPQASRNNFYDALSVLGEGKVPTAAEEYAASTTMNDDDYNAFREAVIKARTTQRGEIGNIPSYNTSINAAKDEIMATGLFSDDGKETDETKQKFARFKGSVIRQIMREEQMTGKETTEARRREIILGMAANYVVGSKQDGFSSLGRNYEIEEEYSRIPAATRQQLYASLLRANGGRRRPTQADIVQEMRRRNTR